MEDDYNRNVETFRDREYPMAKDAIYLDHAGTTLYSKSLMERFMSDMMSNLYGNPHSASPSSQLSTTRIEDIRLEVLRFFHADPEKFDVVFVANATAGIKLVADAFRELEGGFNYGYHRDAHTSIVGVRESATKSRCLTDEDVECWLSGGEGLVEQDSPPATVSLFAYPAQSNLDGRRLPLSWTRRAKDLESLEIYVLLDASAFVSTAQLDLSDPRIAPDFTVLSFYKVFGFPDLGALIVRKDSGKILRKRKYFGGGTVDIVLSMKEQWHSFKENSLHESLEDGTLPFHSIMALKAAIDTHRDMYGSMDRIAKHTAFLSKKLYNGLSLLRHGNSEPVCIIHSPGFSSEGDLDMQGPIIAFNLCNSYGAWISNTEFEKLASVRKFHIRSGGLCNPGGVAASLNLEPWEMRRNFSAGLRCGVETDIYAGKITGILRASLGAMSTIDDVEAFISFVREFYVESNSVSQGLETRISNETSSNLFVESLTIYPIKSCGGFNIPRDTNWEVKPEGLAWDREWCLVHQGTAQALSQKRHPQMALIRPEIDFQKGMLRVRYANDNSTTSPLEISIPLSANPAFSTTPDERKFLPSRVCGDAIVVQTYTEKINEFFSRVLGISCALARFPTGGAGFGTRHSKAHMQKHQRQKKTAARGDTVPMSYPSPPTPPDSDSEAKKTPILLSNESPILAISRSSLNSLNEAIKKTGGNQASASVFRANIVLASSNLKEEYAYHEDHWTSICIGEQKFQMLGSCRRCHMICVNQETAEKDQEPFVTLAKTRKKWKQSDSAGEEGGFDLVTKLLSLAVGDKDSLLDNDTVGKIQDLLTKKTSLPHELRIYEDQIHGFALRSDLSCEKDRKAIDDSEKQGIEDFFCDVDVPQHQNQSASIPREDYTCIFSQSSPNPIRNQYPNNVTGTLNGTVAMVPIPFSLARSIIPAKYGILTAAYESLLPGFPKNSYPLIVRGGLDHDVGFGNFTISDFEYLLLTSTDIIAINGSLVYGTDTVPATFDPPLEAYAFVKSVHGNNAGETYLDAYVNGSDCAAVTTKFSPTNDPGAWPVEFFMNVTNQPFFNNAIACDNQKFYFNTTLSTGKNSAVHVKGDINIAAPYLPKDSHFRGVYGVKVDAAFVENNLVPCESSGLLQFQIDSLLNRHLLTATSRILSLAKVACYHNEDENEFTQNETPTAGPSIVEDAKVKKSGIHWNPFNELQSEYPQFGLQHQSGNKVEFQDTFGLKLVEFSLRTVYFAQNTLDADTEGDFMNAHGVENYLKANGAIYFDREIVKMNVRVSNEGLEDQDNFEFSQTRSSGNLGEGAFSSALEVEDVLTGPLNPTGSQPHNLFNFKSSSVETEESCTEISNVTSMNHQRPSSSRTVILNIPTPLQNLARISVSLIQAPGYPRKGVEQAIFSTMLQTAALRH
ncbi:hypothetical protein G7Y89_g1988 [Cudoniella acicularis]|uniref:Molybdenum cofactor sulfurase n=1 Tax=Cudoniella acicularis TaxID=354080 RepID=A0A8H4RU72_9HELO|nr:hypothetical protein G7Y89_g1988 [Cudoniella acicularis]